MNINNKIIKILNEYIEYLEMQDFKFKYDKNHHSNIIKIKNIKDLKKIFKKYNFSKNS